MTDDLPTSPPAPPRPPRPRRAHRRARPRRALGRALVPAAVVGAVAALAAVAVARWPGPPAGQALTAVTPAAAAPTTAPPAPAPPGPATTAAPKAPPTTAPPVPPPTAAPRARAVAPRSAPVPPPAAHPVGNGVALCIGDSVMLGASPQYLGTLSMCGTVDAVVGRQFSAGPGVVEAHRPLPATVVVHLGTNGTISAGDLDRLMGDLAGVPRVVLVTVQLSGGRPWEAADNQAIRAAAGRWPNVRVADWKAASDGHPGYVRGDGIHLTGPGGAAYAAAIAAAV